MKTNRYSLLLSAVLLFTSMSTFAQNFGIVLFEDFDDPTTPTGWTQSTDQTFPAGISSTTPSGEWAFGEGPYSGLWNVPASLDGSPFAISNDDAADQNRLEDLLMSPVMDLTPFDSAIFLYETFYDSLFQVSEGYFFISYDAGANWLNLPLTATTFNEGWTEDGVILPNSIVLGGNTYTFNDQMMIAFLHTDNGGWGSGVAVDNVIVAGYNTPCDDVVTIPSCDAPQTITLAGPGVLDWEFDGPCGFRTFGQEQLYSFTPTVSGVHTIEVSAATETSFLDYMYKEASAGCDTLGWNCVADVAAAGEYGGMNLTAGVEYYILVDNEFIDSETQTFSIKCPCSYTSLNGTPEAETCGNTDNNGCALDPAPPTYGSIGCGETISGTTFANGGTRDVDYFEFTVSSELDLEFDFGGGLPLNALIVDNCTDFNVLANTSTGACQTSTLSYTAAAGTYYLIISPTNFEGYLCGAPEAVYDVAMSCACPQTAEAGTITADAATACIDENGEALLSATPNGDQVVPTGYVQAYVLTDADNNLEILQLGTTPEFTVSAGGNYVIHTFVYNPADVDPAALPAGTTGVDVAALLVETGQGGTLCASLDVAGAPITVNAPEVGGTTADATPVCLDAGTADIGAESDGNESVPAGFTVAYVLTDADNNLEILDANATGDFTVTAEGNYVIHTLVYDPSEITDFTPFVGQPAANVAALLSENGGTVCASLDVAGAPIVVEDCTGQIDPCLTSASTYPDLNSAGGAPCNDGNGCTPTDPDFTGFGIGVYGSETYTLDNVQAGADYVFDMCSGVGAGAWIPEITIVAPDGTTVDAWNGEEATGSTLTFIDNCSISWTATQSGTYSIVINELGTAAGDAPSQVDCNTTLAVDNGNPTVLCGPNEAICLPCEVGTLTSPLVQDVCPGETFDVALSGNSTPGSYSLFFDNSTTSGLGGTGAPVTITGYSQGDFPLAVDEDINGVLSANQLPVLTGTWEVKVIVVDNAGEDCDSTDAFTVNFLDASDPSCITVGIEEANATSVNVYPNPSNGEFVVEINGIEAMAQLNVLDLTGRTVYTESAMLNENFRKELNLNVMSGTYLLQILTEEGRITRKLQVK